MPKVFRTMKKDGDGLPTEGPSPKGLGVRVGTDIHIDPASGTVILDGFGMSVSPDWRLLKLYRIPSRLRDQVKGARGPDDTFCFTMGEGAFERAPIAVGLELIPDSDRHGSVAPTAPVPIAEYLAAISGTRSSWQVEESRS